MTIGEKSQAGNGRELTLAWGTGKRPSVVALPGGGLPCHRHPPRLSTQPDSRHGDHPRRTSHAQCAQKGRSTGGESPHPASRQRSREVNSPGLGEIPASKRGGAKLQAATKVNPKAAPKYVPVRERVGRAWWAWAKTAVRGLGSGAPRNHSGVSGVACSEGWSVTWGGPPPPGGVVNHPGSVPAYKATPKLRGVERESERDVVPMTAETTQLGKRKGPVLWWRTGCKGRVRAW